MCVSHSAPSLYWAWLKEVEITFSAICFVKMVRHTQAIVKFAVIYNSNSNSTSQNISDTVYLNSWCFGPLNVHVSVTHRFLFSLLVCFMCFQIQYLSLRQDTTAIQTASKMKNTRMPQSLATFGHWKTIKAIEMAYPRQEKSLPTLKEKLQPLWVGKHLQNVQTKVNKPQPKKWLPGTPQ